MDLAGLRQNLASKLPIDGDRACMNIQSLGYRTDLIFHHFNAEVIDRGEYVVVRTPSNPGFFWGNSLFFAEPPALGRVDMWKSLFAEEVGGPPTIRHYAFGWDTIDGTVGEIQQFLDLNFAISSDVALATSTLRSPPHYNHDVDIRPLAQASEWETATLYKIDNRDPVYSLNGYTGISAAKCHAIDKWSMQAWSMVRRIP